MKPIFVIVLLSLFSLHSHAGLNKWVDENGKVHYSDAPPTNVQAEQIKNYSGKGQVEAPATYSSKSYVEREAELKKSKQDKAELTAKKGQEEAAVAAKKQNCTASQNNLRTLQDSSRIVTYDAKGEKVYLDDAAREQKINEARKNVSANCN